MPRVNRCECDTSGIFDLTKLTCGRVSMPILFGKTATKSIKQSCEGGIWFLEIPLTSHVFIFSCFFYKRSCYFPSPWIIRCRRFSCCPEQICNNVYRALISFCRNRLTFSWEQLDVAIRNSLKGLSCPSSKCTLE